MDDIYKSLIACDSKSFNTCYYCSDESNNYDYIPPLKYSNRFIRDADADYIKVPVCSECSTLLKGNQSPYFNEHVDIVKKGLKKKYAKALSIYELWNDKEAKSVEGDLSVSINAGLKLGEEAYNRYKFRGFSYELDGVVIPDKEEEPVDSISIFGEPFDEFRDALEYASYTYQIPKVMLQDLLKVNGNDFDSAIQQFQSKVENNFEAIKNSRLCADFCDEHCLSFVQVHKKMLAQIKKDKSTQPEQWLLDILPSFYAEYRDFLFFIISRCLDSGRKYTIYFNKNKETFDLESMPKRPSSVYKRNWKEIHSDLKYYRDLDTDNDYILDSINYISYEMIQDHRKIKQSDLKEMLYNNDITNAKEYKAFLLDIDGYETVNCFPDVEDLFPTV
jgi:hypothetical protein